MSTLTRNNSAVMRVNSTRTGASLDIRDGAGVTRTIALGGGGGGTTINGLSGAVTLAGGDNIKVNTTAQAINIMSTGQYVDTTVVTGDTTLTATQAGSLVQVNCPSNTTITLPNSTSLTDKTYTFSVQKLSGTGTLTVVSPNTSDYFNVAGTTSVVIANNLDAVSVTNDMGENNWFVTRSLWAGGGSTAGLVKTTPANYGGNVDIAVLDGNLSLGVKNSIDSVVIDSSGAEWTAQYVTGFVGQVIFKGVVNGGNNRSTFAFVTATNLIV